MITITRILCFMLILSSTAFAQPKAYNLFNNKGKEVTYSKMVKDLKEADIVFFGELHNNPICHWLQLEVTRDLYSTEIQNLVLGAEMFETDNQLLLNEYIENFISEKSFEKEARLWPNYKTDYKSIVTFAKENSLSFIATNVPRRYASSVFKNGLDKLDKLPEYAKVCSAPLPIKED